MTEIPELHTRRWECPTCSAFTAVNQSRCWRCNAKRPPPTTVEDRIVSHAQKMAADWKKRAETLEEQARQARVREEAWNELAQKYGEEGYKLGFEPDEEWPKPKESPS